MAVAKRERKAVPVQLPFTVVLVMVAIAGLRIWQYHWREGAVIIGVALVVAAVLRAMLSDEQAGLLAVRGRPVDVLSYGGLGVVVLIIAFTISHGPTG